MASDICGQPVQTERAAISAQALALLDSPLVERAVRELRRLGIPAAPQGVAEQASRRKGVAVHKQGACFPSNRARPPVVPEGVAGMPAFMREAARHFSPGDEDGEALSPLHEASIRYVHERLSSDGGGRLLCKERERKMGAMSRIAAFLRPLEARLRALMPPHIARMGRKVPVALIHACVRAFDLPDAGLALGFMVGFEPVDAIPTSGWWSANLDPALVDLDKLHNAGWHDTLEAQLRADFSKPSHAADTQAVWEKTRQEVDKGLINGPFTRVQLERDAAGLPFRAMQRFAVRQNGKVRACDNARASLHNDGTSTSEKLECESADFPARVAKLFATLAKGEGSPPPAMWGGTDDLSDAYRWIPSSQPSMTCFVLSNPQSGASEWYTLPGFNFCLKSAVLQFNRYALFLRTLASRFLGIVVSNFYDDFACVEPFSTCPSAQSELASLAAILGSPFSDEKHAPAGPRVLFLGVESDLTDSACGVIQIAVRPERVARILDEIEAAIESGELPLTAAASLAGKLAFCLSWSFGRLGRAALQPIYSCQTSKLSRLSPGVAASLVFFSEVLPLIPPHTIFTSAPKRRPALVWSDGMWEPGQASPGQVGFLAGIPKPRFEFVPPRATSAPLDDEYDFFHASAVVPTEMVDALCCRGQQIGQVEIIGALAPYLSIPNLLAGRPVIHWIDNTSALAALVKGYSGVPDSARLIHVFHAWNSGAQARVWFEYVPTKENPADEPSRADLSETIYEPAPDVTSVPVPLALPELELWSDPAGWMAAGS